MSELRLRFIRTRTFQGLIEKELGWPLFYCPKLLILLQTTLLGFVILHEKNSRIRETS